jgi:hypothetical protein
VRRSGWGGVGEEDVRRSGWGGVGEESEEWMMSDEW